MSNYKDGTTKHPLEVLGTAICLLTLLGAYLGGGTWAVTALFNQGLGWLGLIVGGVLALLFGAILAGSGSHIREQYLVRKDCP